VSFFLRVVIISIVGIVGPFCFAQQNAGPSKAPSAASKSSFIAWLKKRASNDDQKAKTPIRAELDSLPALHHSSSIDFFPMLEIPIEPIIDARPFAAGNDTDDDDLGGRQESPQPFLPYLQTPQNQDPATDGDGDAPLSLHSASDFSSAPSLDFLDLMWPVETRTISSGWGPRRRTATVIVKTPEGSRRISKPYTGSHKGIDLTAPQGHSIFAAMDGRVVGVGRDRMMGNYVTIDHGGGIETFYGHNKTNLVAIGEMVRRGQIIATVGSTGRSTGPHVHFEVRANGQQVNPAPFLNDVEELSPEIIGINERTLSKAPKANKR
jgi:murein DD-endopeptidase MepM/ murein hydrolase activator NlpD